MINEEFEIKEDNGKIVKLTLKNPSPEDVDEADKVYALKVASLIKQKGTKHLLLRQTLDEYLRDSGIWTDADETKLQSLQKELNDILNKIRKGGVKESEGRKLCIQCMDKRKEMVKVASKKQVFDNVTLESLAETEKIDYLVYSSILYAETGDKYWDSFEDMKNDKLSNVYNIGVQKVLSNIYGVDNEFEKRLPENRWLKKHGFVDEDLNYVDKKTHERVDRDGNLLKQVEKELKQQIDNLQGEIEEEVPFIDDDTNEPVVFNKEQEKEKEEVTAQNA
jgi:hypothetical protein